MRTLDSGSAELPRPTSEWDATVDATPRRLGIPPLETAVRDVETAAARGFAAASVVLGQRALEGGRPDEAIAALDGAILSLQAHRHVALSRFLAVTHYLRGAAYEAKELVTEALDDYAKTLVLAPDHATALAARARLQARRGEA